MVCGVHLGILLICLVQAERVRCLWATQARGQNNNNTHVGFSQQRGGFGGNYSQNQLRRASGSPGSVQSSSFNTDPEVSTGYRKRFPSSRYSQTVSQTAKSVFASVGLARSRSESKPNWRTTKLNQGNVQKIPKKQPFGLSTFAGRSSLSKKRTLPVQQGAPSPSHLRSSGSASLQSPRESFKSSSPSSAGPAASQRIPVQTKTSASAAARRVSSRRGSKPRNDPSQTRAGTPHPSKLDPVNVRHLPASGTSSAEASGRGFAQPRTHNIPQHFGGSAIRRLRGPADQKEVGVRKQQHQVYVAQRPLDPHQVYVAPQRPLDPQQVYVAPQRPLDPQQVYVAPQRPLAQQQIYVAQRPSAYFKPQVQTVTPEPRRGSGAQKRIRSRLGR